jgi:aminoglycoside phosphotransferase (APT) family kinase protein
VILVDGQIEPFLIVKVPRLAGDHVRLGREAKNLEKVQAAWRTATDSVPSLITYEEYAGSQLLVETAQRGQKLSSLLRNGFSQSYIEAVAEWLIEFHQATQTTSEEDMGWYQRLVQEPVGEFQRIVRLSSDEKKLVEQTQALIHDLRYSDIQLVFEHGDLGPPNILIASDNCPGVVDWELAVPKGLPAVDLFFFLTLIGFNRRRAKTNPEYISAFRETFFGQSAWARPYVERYGGSMGLSPETLRALFAVCWIRYVAGLVLRLHDSGDSAGPLDGQTAQWLRSNRYFSLWRYSVEHFVDLNIS